VVPHRWRRFDPRGLANGGRSSVASGLLRGVQVDSSYCRPVDNATSRCRGVRNIVGATDDVGFGSEEVVVGSVVETNCVAERTLYVVFAGPGVEMSGVNTGGCTDVADVWLTWRCFASRVGREEQCHLRLLRPRCGDGESVG
jgi:hypothetical protein